MKEFTVTIFMRICVCGLLVIVILGVIISAIIGTNLSQCLAMLTELDTALMTGIPIADQEAYSITSIRRDLSNLRWITYLTVGGALAVLCAGVFTIIWLGARTISHQTQELQLRVGELSALNKLIHRQLGLEKNHNQRQQPFPPDIFLTPITHITAGSHT